jgi:hypothetical protein
MTQADWITEERGNAELRRDLGIDRATSHAEHDSDGWNDRADRALFSFLIEQCGVPFLAEQFVDYALKRYGMQPPPDARAWGGPVRRAALARRIVKVGYAPANTSNRSPKVVWQEGRADATAI